LNEREAQMIREYVTRKLVPGAGIAINKVGDNLVISAIGPPPIALPASGGETWSYVLELPDYPESGKKLVFWCGEDTGVLLFGEAGTGDDQFWECVYPQKRYYCKHKYTAEVGVPITMGGGT